jgi:chromosome segregation ATPase
MDSSDTLPTASSSPVQPMMALPSDSRKAKGAALVLKVTQHGDLLETMSQDLANMVKQSTGRNSVINDLQTSNEKLTKDLHKANKKIKDLDDQIGMLLKVVEGISDRYDEVLKRIPESESESDEHPEEGLTEADRERMEASLAAYGDNAFKVRKSKTQYQITDDEQFRNLRAIFMLINLASRSCPTSRSCPGSQTIQTSQRGL